MLDARDYFANVAVQFTSINSVTNNMDSSVESHRRVIGSVFVLFAALGFSAKAVLIKLAYAQSAVDSITLLALRMVMVLPFFLLAGWWSAKRVDSYRLGFRDWLSLILLGMIGYYLASFLDFQGLLYISAGLERLILFLYPTLVILLSSLINGTRVSQNHVIALVLSYVGISIVFIENMSGEYPQLWLGAGLVFASAFSFAIYMMGSGVMILKLGSAKYTAYTMSVACIVTSLHFLVAHGGQIIDLPIDIYAIAFLMALISTVMPAFFMNAGILRLGAGPASIISSAGPVGTIALAYFFLGEQLTRVQVFGALLVLTGVFAVTRDKSQKRI